MGTPASCRAAKVYWRRTRATLALFARGHLNGQTHPHRPIFDAVPAIDLRRGQQVRLDARVGRKMGQRFFQGSHRLAQVCIQAKVQLHPARARSRVSFSQPPAPPPFGSMYSRPSASRTSVRRSVIRSTSPITCQSGPDRPPGIDLQQDGQAADHVFYKRLGAERYGQSQDACRGQLDRYPRQACRAPTSTAIPRMITLMVFLEARLSVCSRARRSESSVVAMIR